FLADLLEQHRKDIEVEFIDVYAEVLAGRVTKEGLAAADREWVSRVARLTADIGATLTDQFDTAGRPPRFQHVPPTFQFEPRRKLRPQARARWAGWQTPASTEVPTTHDWQSMQVGWSVPKIRFAGTGPAKDIALAKDSASAEDVLASQTELERQVVAAAQR